MPAGGYPDSTPGHTLGGTGGGTAYNDEELTEIVTRGLKSSAIHQALIERSVAGYKEIEFEVMRDHNDNCITICSMENIDPVGIPHRRQHGSGPGSDPHR